MGETVHAAAGAVKKAAVRATLCMDTPCGVLLRELEQIWTEIGEHEEDKDRMFMELERECMQVYRRKVQEAGSERARLHQLVAAQEAELAALVASLGETSSKSKARKKHSSLKEQLQLAEPILEELRRKKDDRVKQLTEVQSEIAKITAEFNENSEQFDHFASVINEDYDLSIRKLNEYDAQLRKLQKEKSDRLHKVRECVNEVHSLCGVLGIDFSSTVCAVHPSLHETGSNSWRSISDQTLEGLALTILKLKTEKKTRFVKLRENVEALFELWNLLESPEEECRRFAKVVRFLGSTEDDTMCTGILSEEFIKETEDEVVRLTKLKAVRMKELVLRKRSELEEICRNAHVEPDMSTSPEKIIAIIDSGMVDPSNLLASIEKQIASTLEEAALRKDIMERINKWRAACEEENWLEKYEQDDSRYSAGRGSHLNLRRAEKARILVQKIPAMVDNLMTRTFAWEDEKKMPFLYDGVRLSTVLEEYNLSRLQREEEKRRLRDQKKLQNLLLTEKELTLGSKPSPRKANSFNRRPNGPKGSMPGFMTPAPRRGAPGSSTPELLTPRSVSGRSNSYFRDNRRMAQLNVWANSREESMSSFASEEPGSPLHLP